MSAPDVRTPGEVGTSSQALRDTERTEAAIVAPDALAGNEVCDDRTSARQKRLATLVAELALSGHAVYELAEGGYVVSRWCMTRHCPGVDALQAFARQIGVDQ